ncbi:hypothetical protein [Paraliomyxa miuraensis]|uniref:hypothetical protein n=1 Tax=Paraliomyxa miuraensis TaxID=376150 RepID=UPI002259CCB7|nr:hypothetical protein [Paraliomyxa miuraensis]MCX4245394.1 hypothetical protein [Paraliomyxa miuraensis]
MRHRGGYSAAWAAALIALTGCTRVSDRSRFEGPQEQLEILLSAPAPGERGVDPEIRIDLCLSGRIDPRSLDEIDATVSSGGAITDSEFSVQLVPWLSPGEDRPPDDRRAPWCGGSVLSIEPKASLLPGAQFRLRLFPSAVGWAGEELSTDGPQWVTDEGADEPRYVVEFTVDPTPSLEPFPEDDPTPPVTLRDLFTDGRVFDPSTDTCRCHRDPDDLALARLDLRDPAVATVGLLGSAQPRDTGFAMVAPRDPSQSFLVQKLLRDDHEQGQGEALYGVLGDPMPPDEPLRYADLLPILQWIADGAEP